MEATTASLKEVPLFAELSDDDLALLSEHLEPKTFAAGEYVFRRGDPGGGLYLVSSGEVELAVQDNTGQKLRLESVGEKGFFGEVSLLDGQARSADAVALEPTRTLRLDREDLELLFQKNPAAAFAVFAQVTRRLRQANALLRQIKPASPNQAVAQEATAFERFADWLAYFSGTLPFLLFHVAWFGLWVLINSHLFPVLDVFDPFPFGLLTMVVSLEAIFLSCVVLISQNRQATRDRIRSDAEYDANIRAAAEVTQLHAKMDRFEEMVVARLDAMQAPAKPSPGAGRSQRSA